MFQRVPLTIMSVCHAMYGCSKNDATDSELLCFDDWWLMGERRLSSGYRNCEECDQCSILGNEVATGWFGSTVQSIIGMSHSLIGGAKESACPAKSVDKEVCCAWHISGFHK